MRISDTIVAFHYRPGETSREGSLLASNLKQWGERFRYMLHWVFEIPAVDVVHNQPNVFPDQVERFQPAIPSEVFDFPFAAKVIAAGEAEELAEQAQTPQLVWMDPDTLLIQEPTALFLPAPIKIAIPPVHLKNISSPVDQPIDEFWSLIYSLCKVPKKKIFNITSSVDHQLLRAHFNAGLISVKPQVGILRRWRDNFMSICLDRSLKPFYQLDIRYKYFVHQAVLAGTILANCTKDEVNVLPSTYNFPLHLTMNLKPEEKPARLNNLITVRYDTFDSPEWATVLPVDEPYRSWLDAAVKKLTP